MAWAQRWEERSATTAHCSSSASTSAASAAAAPAPIGSERRAIDPQIGIRLELRSSTQPLGHQLGLTDQCHDIDRDMDRRRIVDAVDLSRGGGLGPTQGGGSLTASVGELVFKEGWSVMGLNRGAAGPYKQIGLVC
jgi:hypothetical protein